MSLGIKAIWRVCPQLPSVAAARLSLFPRELHPTLNHDPVSREVEALRCPPSSRLLSTSPRLSTSDSTENESSSSPESSSHAEPSGMHHVALVPKTRSPGEALIAHLDTTPVIPTGKLSVLVEPAYDFPHRLEARRSRHRHHRSMARQKRLEELRQTRLQPLADWRVVLQHLIRFTPAYKPPVKDMEINEGHENMEEEGTEEHEPDEDVAPGETDVTYRNNHNRPDTYASSTRKPKLDYPGPYFIRTTADEIPRPRPGEWTTESFYRYIRALVNSRIPEGQASAIYERGRTHTAAVIDLLHEAFNDESVKEYISLPAFRKALSYMTINGYQDRVDARALYARMELLGLRMDTGVHEIMLESNAGKVKDLANFSNVLALMHRKHCLPRFNTWIIFLRLIESDGLRRHIIRKMHDLRLLDAPGAGKRLVRVMAGLDTHRAIAAGVEVEDFLKQQEEAYGPDWQSIGTANSIIEVYMSYGRLPDCRTVIESLAHAPPPQPRPNTVMLNTLLKHCALHNSLRSAIAVLRYLDDPAVGVKPDSVSYTILFDAARRRRFTLVMSVIWRYASLSKGGISVRMRRLASEALMDAERRRRADVKTQERKGTQEQEQTASTPGLIRFVSDPLRAKPRVPVFMNHFNYIFKDKPFESHPEIAEALRHTLPNGRLRDSGTFLGTVASRWYAKKYKGCEPSERLGVVLNQALYAENKALKKRAKQTRWEMRQRGIKTADAEPAAEEAAEDEDGSSEELGISPLEDAAFPIQLRRRAGRKMPRWRQFRKIKYDYPTPKKRTPKQKRRKLLKIIRKIGKKMFSKYAYDYRPRHPPKKYLRVLPAYKSRTDRWIENASRRRRTIFAKATTIDNDVAEEDEGNKARGYKTFRKRNASRNARRVHGKVDEARISVSRQHFRKHLALDAKPPVDDATTQAAGAERDEGEATDTTGAPFRMNLFRKTRKNHVRNKTRKITG